MDLKKVFSFRLTFFAAHLFIVSAFLIISPLLYGQEHGQPPTHLSLPSLEQLSSASHSIDPFDISRVQVVYGVDNKPIATSEYKCFLPPLNSVSPASIGVVDLQAPFKSQNEYESACRSLQKNKNANAEKHLRTAIAGYERYAAAWVLLGQLLEACQKLEEARSACSKSVEASSSYLPGFLCLADISTRQEHWLDALTFSARALDIDSTGNPVGYVLNATANLNLHHLAEAEESALRASKMDVRNSEPRVHYLLAQIYAAKGDRTRTIAQLHEYLKYAKEPGDVAVVKNSLLKLEDQPQE
jgi:tetratricopeptide (TPR) repeat protein